MQKAILLFLLGICSVSAFPNEIHHVESDRDFDDELRKAGDQLVIVGFINSTHREAHYLQYYLPVKVYIIEVDVKKDKKWVMDRYGLNIMPSCIFLENGEVLKRLEDAKTHQINAAYEAIISDPYLQNRKKAIPITFHLVEDEDDYDDQLVKAGDRLAVVCFADTSNRTSSSLKNRIDLDLITSRYGDKIYVMAIDFDKNKRWAMERYEISETSCIFLYNDHIMDRTRRFDDFVIDLITRRLTSDTYLRIKNQDSLLTRAIYRRIRHIESEDELDHMSKKAGDKLVVVAFTETSSSSASSNDTRDALEIVGRGGTHVWEVDFDKNKKWAMDRYGIKTAPSCIFLRNGRVTTAFDKHNWLEVLSAVQSIKLDGVTEVIPRSIRHIESGDELESLSKKLENRIVAVAFTTASSSSAESENTRDALHIIQNGGTDVVVEVDFDKHKEWVIDGYVITTAPSCVFLQNGRVSYAFYNYNWWLKAISAIQTYDQKFIV